MREYETIFVTRADESDSRANQLLERVDSIIEKHSGTLLQKKNWGRREMAYKVQKRTHGNYHYYNYVADSTAVADLERTLKLNEFAMKFLTVKLADNVDAEARKNEISQLEKAASDAAAQKVAAEAVPEKTTEEASESKTKVSADASVGAEGSKEVKDA